MVLEMIRVHPQTLTATPKTATAKTTEKTEQLELCTGTVRHVAKQTTSRIDFILEPIQ